MEIICKIKIIIIIIADKKASTLVAKIMHCLLTVCPYKIKVMSITRLVIVDVWFRVHYRIYPHELPARSSIFAQMSTRD